MSVAVLALAAGAAHASALSAFHTPGWRVQCTVAGEEAPPVLTCSIPADGSFLSMAGDGRPRAGSDPKGRGYRDPFAARRLLGFGRYWKFGSLFGCVSRSTSLKCWNKAGHGWTIARDGRKERF